MTPVLSFSPLWREHFGEFRPPQKVRTLKRPCNYNLRCSLLSPTDAKGETSKILDAQTKLNQTIPLAFRTPWLLYVCVCVYKGLVKLKIMSFSKRRKNMIVSQEQGESQIAQNKHNHHYFKFHSMLGFKIGTIWVIIMPMVKFSRTMLAELFTLLFLLQDIANR